MVARQFRVLEAASSSPATSTKTIGGAVAPPYCFDRVYRLDKLREAECECANFVAQASSLLVSQARNYFAEGKAPATQTVKSYWLSLHLERVKTKKQPR